MKNAFLDLRLGHSRGNNYAIAKVISTGHKSKIAGVFTDLEVDSNFDPMFLSFNNPFFYGDYGLFRQNFDSDNNALASWKNSGASREDEMKIYLSSDLFEKPKSDLVSRIISLADKSRIKTALKTSRRIELTSKKPDKETSKYFEGFPPWLLEDSLKAGYYQRISDKIKVIL